jgi:predicted ATPase
MLKQLGIENFKSAKKLLLDLAPLTVLAGLNGSGKSTVLQALALLKQSADEGGAEFRLHLRGTILELGRGEDVHFENADEEHIAFSLVTDAGSARIAARVEKSADTLRVTTEGSDILAVLKNVFRHFQYIEADRLPPATQFGQASTVQREAGWLGCRGEFTADFLARCGDSKVSPQRRYPHDALGVSEELYKSVAPTDELLDQTAGWLQQISPGVRIRPSSLDFADSVALRFDYSGVRIESGTRLYRATNVGFGLTYSLPIVVACLAAPAGALLLLENPEAHLHPQGQAAFGSLLARCAADDVQVIVETHSDHVLNGIRLAVKQNLIKADDVVLKYFSRDVETGESKLQSPKLLPDGQLSDWPIGFMDQWDRSLDALLD